LPIGNLLLLGSGGSHFFAPFSGGFRKTLATWVINSRPNKINFTTKFKIEIDLIIIWYFSLVGGG
jgi:hypothetical protein